MALLEWDVWCHVRFDKEKIRRTKSYNSIINLLFFFDFFFPNSLFIPDLTPNIGLYWYFFIEMFEQFRSLFLFVFQMLAFAFVGPICIKFR